MIAVDTNILVYAHREDSSWHAKAVSVVRELAEGRTAWAIAWPCLHEFLAIVTHPRIYKPPTPLEKAIDQVEAWLESPRLVLLSEAHDYWGVLRRSIESGRVGGPKIHDARVAALCQHHGVRVLWTADRDFSRFKELAVHNPLID
jgi:toxin-antitoxin system PIN domain toxin